MSRGLNKLRKVYRKLRARAKKTPDYRVLRYTYAQFMEDLIQEGTTCQLFGKNWEVTRVYKNQVEFRELP